MISRIIAFLHGDRQRPLGGTLPVVCGWGMIMGEEKRRFRAGYGLSVPENVHKLSVQFHTISSR